MILCRGGRYLGLRNAESLHVILGKRRIDIHKNTTLSAIVLSLRRQFHALGHIQQPGDGFFRRMYIPPAIKNRKRTGAIPGIHFVRPNSQCDIPLSGLNKGAGRVEGRTGTGTGILDIGNRNPLETSGPQGNLPRHQILRLNCRLGGVCKKCGLNIIPLQTGVFQSLFNNFGSHVLDGTVQELPELRHSYSNDIYI